MTDTAPLKPLSPRRLDAIRSIRVSVHAVGPVADRVSALVLYRVKEIVRELTRVSPPAHPIRVRVTPSYVVGDPKDVVGFGRFDDETGFGLVIWVAGWPIPELTRDEWLAWYLPETIAHEWAHYEQHRAGKPIQERGVVVRATNLLKLIGVKGWDR